MMKIIGRRGEKTAAGRLQHISLQVGQGLLMITPKEKEYGL